MGNDLINRSVMLSRREMDVLDILYRAGRPLIVTEIVNTGKDLTQSTVTAVLRKLLGQGMVEVTGAEHSGKVLSRTYRPTGRSKEALVEAFMELYRRFAGAVPAEELCGRIMEEDRAQRGGVRDEVHDGSRAAAGIGPEIWGGSKDGKINGRI